MAYLFGKLNNVVAGRSSDVLNGQNSQQNTEETNSNNQALNTQPSAVISGSAPQTQVTGLAANENANAVNSESRGKAFSKNQNANLVADTSQVSKSIADSSKGLQESANKYVTEQNYGQVGNEVINSAVDKGDATAKSSISSLLYGAAPQAKKFEYDQSSLNPYKDQVASYNTTGGLQSKLQDQGNITQGEARLDAALLGRSKAFQDQRQAVIGDFANLQGATDRAKKQTDDAVTLSNTNREADKLRVRDVLGNLKSGVYAGNAKEFADFKNSDASQLTASQNALKAERAAMAKQALNSAGFADGQFEFNKVNELLGDRFVSSQGAVNDEASFMDQGEADRVNRVNELLGLGDRASLGQSKASGASLDKVGLGRELTRLIDEQKTRLAAESAARAESERVAAIAAQQAKERSDAEMMRKVIPILPKLPTVNPNAGTGTNQGVAGNAARKKASEPKKAGVIYETLRKLGWG